MATRDQWAQWVRGWERSGRDERARVLMGETPELPIPRGLAGPGMLADTLVRRWDDHSPLHRMERIYARDGLELARSTICQWHAQAELDRCVQSSDYPCIEEKLVAAEQAGVVAEDLAPRRSSAAASAQAQLDLLRGQEPSEPAAALVRHLEAVAVEDPHLPRQRQMVEVLVDRDLDRELDRVAPALDGALGPRRGLDAASTGANILALHHLHELVADLGHVDHLGGLELTRPLRERAAAARARTVGLVEVEVARHDGKHRLRARPRAGARPRGRAALGRGRRVVAAGLARLRRGVRRVQLLEQRERALQLFVTDPRIPLDNNATERGIRGPVVGCKNHYGSKSRGGTEIASIFYSLIETAKLHGVDVAKYLREAVLADRRGETLLPWQLG